MGIKRIVDTAFWTDGKVDEFSPEDKYFMLYLLTNPFSKQLGIYEISIKQAAFQLGYSMDAVKVLIDRFENKYKMIIFSEETNEIAILNFLRHSVVKGGKPVADCIQREMKLVKNRGLIDIVFSHIKDKEDLNQTVKKVIDTYYEINNEINNDNNNDNNNAFDNADDVENENDNDNDNERTVDVSSPVRSTYRKTTKNNNADFVNSEQNSNNNNETDPNDVLQTFCGNVMLTENQVGELLDKLGLDAFDYYTNRISKFITNGGYVKNPYQTILKWYAEDSGV